MTDRPILFSAPMIRALLDSRKTQTRRMLKMQPPEWANYCEQPVMYNALGQWVPSGLWRWCDGAEDPPRPLRSWPVDDDGLHYWLSLPIASGDLLWAREAWSVRRHEPCLDHERDWQSLHSPVVRYLADGVEIRHAGNRAAGRGIYHGTVEKGRPPIHMPRWASRLTLYVTDVRVQRLHDISEADAQAEGVECDSDGWRDYLMPQTQCCSTATDSFRTLWTRINGHEAWEANPWVAAYTFDVRHGNIDSLPAEIGEAA